MLLTYIFYSYHFLRLFISVSQKQMLFLSLTRYKSENNKKNLFPVIAHYSMQQCQKSRNVLISMQHYCSILIKCTVLAS